jgi:maleylpyruvate isomerase
MTLYGYFLSAASWRVRIALNLKGLPFRYVPVHLSRGEHRAPSYLAMNPQGLLPALKLSHGVVLTQSLAIIEWLEETHPSPTLLPGDAILRARIRAFALALAADTHPLQTRAVLEGLRGRGLEDPAVMSWAAEANARGLEACEALVLPSGGGAFCFGAAPSIADICLVPQLGSARRFGVDVARFPRLLTIEAACDALPAFADATPSRQPDAE